MVTFNAVSTLISSTVDMTQLRGQNGLHLLLRMNSKEEMYTFLRPFTEIPFFVLREPL